MVGRTPFKPILLLFFLWLSLPSLSAQDMDGFWGTIRERIAKKDYLKVNGGINTNFQLNSISGIDRRMDPFTWRLNANLNLDFLGIKAPFSAAFSDANPTYNLPAYAFYGLSPSYKWITLHMGDRSLNFSPYTLNGHNFYGLGVELRPKKFYLGAMYGRLRRARIEDINAIQNIEPSYRRLGYGLKMGFEDEKNAIQVILFKAMDDENSIPDPTVNLAVHPMENVVLGVSGKRQFGSLISFDFDYARSALSRDKRAQEVNSARGGLFRRMLGLYQPRVSSGYHNAFKMGVRFSPSIGQFSLQYERIDPGYRTLGAIWFTNDLENITVGSQLPLFDKKVNLSANIGVERNGLDAAETSKFNRFIGSVSLNAALSERLSLNTSFSNFRTTNRVRTTTIPFVLVDSIVLAQTNISASTSVSYIASDAKNSIFTALFSFQRANTIQDEVIDFDQQSTFYMGMLSHTYLLPDADFSLTSSCLVNTNQNNLSDLVTVGPSINLSKSFMDKKLSLNLTTSYSLVYVNGSRTNSVLSLQLGSAWQLSKKQSIQLRASQVFTNTQTGAIDNRVFQESIIGLNYGYRF